MPSLPEQIRTLLTEDRTEAAIDALLDWAKASYATLYDQVVLLRARWEKIEQESNLGLISREEAMRQTSQVNVALLHLLGDLERRPAAPAFLAAPSDTRSRWLPILFGGLVLVGVAAFFWARQTDPAVYAPAEKLAPPTVRFPQGESMTLVENGEEVSYKILEAQLEKLSAGEQRLSLRLLCSPMLTPRRSLNFWAANFRFVSAGQPPVAPSNNLNLVAESHASTEGDVQFVLPVAVRGGELRIKFNEKELPLEISW